MTPFESALLILSTWSGVAGGIFLREALRPLGRDAPRRILDTARSRGARAAVVEASALPHNRYVHSIVAGLARESASERARWFEADLEDFREELRIAARVLVVVTLIAAVSAVALGILWSISTQIHVMDNFAALDSPPPDLVPTGIAQARGNVMRGASFAAGILAYGLLLLATWSRWIVSGPRRMAEDHARVLVLEGR